MKLKNGQLQLLFGCVFHVIWVILFKEPLSWIFENDCLYGVEYSSKGMKISCKDLYLKVHRI